MAKVQLSLFPPLGFMDSMPRQDVPLNAITGPSSDWLISHKRWRRRRGTKVRKSGMLESSWSALARRVIAATLPSLEDGFPSPLTLFTNETTKSATLCFRSTNGATWTAGALSGETYRTVGQEFSATHYPDAALVHHRVLPLVYRNQYGGLTVHRLNSAEHRRHMAAGSRDVLQVGTQVCVPGFDAVPIRWNGRFNDATGSGSEVYDVAPLGLVPPLQMPTLIKGTDLLTSTVGPFKGSSAFFVSLLFENDAGELSMFAVPRPKGSAWASYAGFGYFQVDSSNPTHFFDSVKFTNIAEGPPGTVKKWLLISDVVDTATTGAGALVQPSIGNLALLDKIPQGQTSYTCTNSNVLGLDPDPRITEMIRGLLTWPPCARNMGRFDGHITLNNLRPNPMALILAPWSNGALNLDADSAGLYTGDVYGVAVTPTSLVLRKVHSGSATDTSISLAARSLNDLIVLINSGYSASTLTHTATDYSATVGYFVGYGDAGDVIPGMTLSTTVADIHVGDEVSGDDWASGTTVVGYSDTLVPGHTVVFTSLYPTATVTGGTKTITFTSRSISTSDPKPWGGAVVPGADLFESAESLLRTRVSTTGTIASGSAVITSVTSADCPYISPGMTTTNARFASGTTVIAVDEAAHTVTMSANALTSSSGGETVLFGYDTGDTASTLSLGFIRAFGNAFPALLPWSLDYLDRFDDSPQASTFSAASPGYAQDAINTWKVSNRRSGPAAFGAMMGQADVGPVELRFFSRGCMVLENPRTGLTHDDNDYTMRTASWTRGARSPYAICAGNGWVLFLSDEGFFVTGTSGEGKALISKAIYDAERDEGSRGTLEYAIGECIVASESGTDAYKISAQVHGGVLRVRYFASSSSTRFDREIRYDFSEGVGRTGPAEVLKPDGSPYPWSAPLTISASCSEVMAQGDGAVHTYAVADIASNGTLVEIDTGSDDDGVRITPVGYTGLFIPPDLSKIQPTLGRFVSTKAGSGLSVALTREPEKAPEAAKWDVMDVDTSGPDAFGRCVPWLEPAESAKRIAIAARIADDGTGSGAELSAALFDCEQRLSVEK